jgi:hypothetical protein
MILSMVRAAAIGGVVLVVATDRVAGFELISPEEAAQPDFPTAALEVGLRGVTRGPAVTVVSPPPEAGLVKSPVNLVINFKPRGGTAIDPRSVVVTYMKKDPIDLTQRVENLITAQGIEVRDAEIPPGTHYIRVRVKDSAAHLVSNTFAVKIQK